MGKVAAWGSRPGSQNNDPKFRCSPEEKRAHFFRNVALLALRSDDMVNLLENDSDEDAVNFMIWAISGEQDNFVAAGAGCNFVAVRDPVVIRNPRTGNDEVRGPRHLLEINRVFVPEIDTATGKAVMVPRMQKARDPESGKLCFDAQGNVIMTPVLTGAKEQIFDPKCVGTNKFHVSFRYFQRNEEGGWQTVDICGKLAGPPIVIDMGNREESLVRSF